MQVMAVAPGALPRTDMTNRYETMMLLRPDASEVERSAEVKKAEQLLTSSGVKDLEVTLRDASGVAYAIKGHNRMYYVQLNYTSTPAAVEALHKMYNIPVVGAEPVLVRYMTLKQKKSATVL